MKKTVSVALALIMCLGILCGCGKEKEKSELAGSWYMEENGVGITLSFTEDGKMSAVCKMVDKAKADKAGINKQNIEKMNFSCYYSVDEKPDISDFPSQLQESLKGKKVLKQYQNKKNADNKNSDADDFFLVKDGKLILTKKTGLKSTMTGAPEYKDYVFTSNDKAD